MKNLSIFLPTALLLVNSCTSDNDPALCHYADQISAEQTCYDSMQGLTFTASGHQKGSGSLEWEVYVSNDTTINALDDLRIKQMGSESFTVPDSILRDYSKVLVKVATNCQGQLLHSIYFSFVRRQGNTCPTWVEQRI